MYKISVPIMAQTFSRTDRNKMVEDLNKIGAKRVFLALDSYICDEEKLDTFLKQYKNDVAFFKEQGFEVGSWMWTFMIKGDKEYVHITSPAGVVCKNQVCPSDERFVEFASAYVKKVAECGVDLMMFDDDYRYSFLDGGVGCTCENHLKYMKQLLGEDFELEEIKEKLVSGGGNKYRSAWLKANKYYLLNFAKKMREAVNEVNKDIRFGVCSCMGEWDFDGATSIEITKALAGDTKPFLRLIGAPYWAVNKSWENRLQDVIELERMERAWCDGEEIEIFSEGDVFPRPRYKCPSSYLEGFDTALRADGNMDGILKYVFDYTSTDRYENGYVKAQLKNQALYDDIDKMFKNKECVGVRVFEAMKKFEDMDVPKNVDSNIKLPEMFFSPASRMMTACSVPTVYRGKGFATVAFGENAKYISDENLKNGLIIDLAAAKILTERGVDVGLKKIVKETLAREEYYIEEDEYTNLTYDTPVYEIQTDEKAKTESIFADKKTPASYTYENANGQRFLVFAFDAYFCNEALYRQYARARQITDKIAWLCKKELPAKVDPSPDLYTICKQNENSLAIGLWNFFADSVENHKITLDREYKNIKVVGTNAKMNGKEIIISEIKAFEFAFIEVSD